MTRLPDRTPPGASVPAASPSSQSPPRPLPAAGEADPRERFSRSLAAAATGTSERQKPRAGAEAQRVASQSAWPTGAGASQRQDDTRRREDAPPVLPATDQPADGPRDGRDMPVPAAGRRADDAGDQRSTPDDAAGHEAPDRPSPALDVPQPATGTPAPMQPFMADMPAGPPPSSAGQVDQQALALLDRIEAAMSDLATKGVEAEMTVAFASPGAAPSARASGLVATGPSATGLQGLVAQGAVIGRDASGAVAVRLVGVHPHLGAAEAQRLAMQLRRGLEQRRIAVAEVVFDAPSGASQRLIPATARAGCEPG